MGDSDCTPCPTSPSGDGPVIVCASKYVVVSDIFGNHEVLKPKPDSILVHRDGSKPVGWADGSTDDKIRLPNLQGKDGIAFASLVGRDASGFLVSAQPDESKGKQILVAEANAIGWEKFGSNRHCFNGADIEEVDGGCGVQIAAFSTCAPDGQVCLVKLPADQCGSLGSNGAFSETNPAGIMQMYGGTPLAVPDGWLLCDGRIVDPATYPALFAKIGYNWGRSGSNFNLPDMRGVVPRGADEGKGLDPDVNSRTAVNTGGNVAENVGSYQDDALQCHEHAGGDITVSKAHTTIGGGATSAIDYVSEVQQTGNTSGLSESDCGEVRTSNENRMKNVYVNFIISVGC